MKKIKLPPLSKDSTFNFHQEGHDAQFDKAMASINLMYDDIFKSEVQLDSIFQNLKVDNNPILQPVSEMFKEVFDPQTVKDQKQYVKLSAKEAQKYKQFQNGLEHQSEYLSQSQIVLGEPVQLEDQRLWNQKL